jgi:N-acetylneuraminate synthase
MLSGAGCTVVAEIAQAHDGSLGTAHAYVDAAAEAGAHAVKFQTHIAAAESTRAEPWRKRFSRQDESRYDYWRRMEFSVEQWGGLAEHARERGLAFLSTPFSLEAADLLERVGVAAWKIGSAEVVHTPLVRRVARTGLPVLLSSGMCTFGELDVAVECVRATGAPLAVLQCTSAYPCPPEKVGLNMLAELQTRYGCPVGLSDHSGTIYSSLAAVALGASLLEVHVVFDRRCFGPDVDASITVDELAKLTQGVDFLGKALSNPIRKNEAAEEYAEYRRIFGRSIVAARGLPAGTVLSLSNVGFKKPGGGLPAIAWEAIEGRRLRKALELDERIEEVDLD